MASSRQRSLLPALALMAVGTAWVCALTLSPRAGEAVAALFPPGTAQDQALSAAAGAGSAEIVALGNWSPVVLVRSDDPALPARLRAAGAWLVVRAPAAAGCLR